MADRVGYVLKKFPRLSETFILRELLGLGDAGLDLTVFSLRQPDPEPAQPEMQRLSADIEYLPWPTRAATLASFRLFAALRPAESSQLTRAFCFVDRLPEESRVSSFVQALHLAAVVERKEISHLHAHFMTVAARTTYLTHLLVGVPFSVTSHAKDIYRNTVDGAIFQEVASAASAVVTVCDANRDYIRRTLLSEEAGRLVRVYNGIEIATQPSARGPREPNSVLAVGRLVEKKGFHVLLASCRLLRDKGVDFRCRIVGDGPQRELLESESRRLGLGQLVEFTGVLTSDAIRELMGRARVLAAPCVIGSDGDRDALPTVLVEALAAGLPVVTTPIGGVAEIVSHDEEGLIVSPGEPGELAGALERVLSDSVLWARLAAAGPVKAARRFDRSQTLPELARLFATSEALPVTRELATR